MIDELAAMPDPYSVLTDEDERLFVAAMAESDQWHRRRNERYRMLWRDQRRPTLPVGVFKRTDLATPTGKKGAWLSSSGSSESGKTQVHFDATSLARIRRAMLSIFIHNGFVDFEPANFLILAPDPTVADHPGYATAFTEFTACAPTKELVYAVNAAGEFLPDVAWDALELFASDSATTFVFGLTVFFEHLALSAPAPLSMRGRLKALTGGGWKGLAKTLSRGQIVDALRASLAVDRDEDLDFRDLFGMTEHPLHYISCRGGSFHLPKYSRFSIVDTDGGNCKPGHPGLIRLQNPFFASLPSHDLRSDDIGVTSAACDCGEALPSFRFIERASSNKGICAQRAL